MVRPVRIALLTRNSLRSFVFGWAFLVGLHGLGHANTCPAHQRLDFSDGSRACLSDYSSVRSPHGRSDNWEPPLHGFYSVAVSAGDRQCPVRIGVGTNTNTSFAKFADQRDQMALEQCGRAISQREKSTNCACNLVIKDGLALPERADFETMLLRRSSGTVAARPNSEVVVTLADLRPNAAPLTQNKPQGESSSTQIAAPVPALAASSTSATPRPALPTIQLAAAASPPVHASASAPSAPVLPIAAPPAPPSRRALVIGNRDYVVGKLKNPVNDARAVGAMLRRLGFLTTQIENLKRDDIGIAIDRFAASIQAGEDVVIFYAGHGLQVKGVNYLPAVDANIRGESDVALNSINVTHILERLDEANAGVRLLLVDACRENPYARSYRSGVRGLARIDSAPAGTLIHFATRPGGVAADGDGDNGLYTAHLLQHLALPGVPVEQMLKRVSSAVRKASGGDQQPWTEGSLDGDFYFAQVPTK